MTDITNISISLPAPRRDAVPQAPVPVKVSQAEPVLRPTSEKSQAGNSIDRLDLVKLASRQLADPFVLGDSRFTIYKDTSGQYVTRLTNLRDGKVTYFPEPELLKRSAQSLGFDEML
jgi:hypothetical protein